ncbi:heparinase II/III domain-containing protein [Sinisalibacter lacisalsi]|uniref:Heparin-sulfate lyase N-terminal domain-containing protein n=1 Tax=Sinisalibacter lacisalsi TaxID=1526570 RepID=A0ABQ1QP42_9RHOB|nr:heparinase II/III family protein [Sinisalibacter lacisalsi]GGD35982.1 hypothetical protein GCM10011358_19730 [Sinisalibacter lacisalsi]
MAELQMTALLRPVAALTDRDLLWLSRHGRTGAADSDRLDLARVTCGRGVASDAGGHVRVHFGASGEGEAISEQVRYGVPEGPVVSGVGMRLRLRGWDKISYIAIGHTEDGTYHHAKATHPVQGAWFDLALGFRDLAWGWRNGWSRHEDRRVTDVRFYIKGVPGPDAGCDLGEVWLWREAEDPEAVFGPDFPVPGAVQEALCDYQKAYFPDYDRLARAFMTEGKCPLAGNALLDWPTDAARPPRLGENGTFQYSWHSLHPAVLLILLAQDTGAVAPLMAARGVVSDWLARSYDKPDPNVKYAWYDHGVAERVFALIMLYAQGQKHGFDARIMARLRRAIHRHGQLLASEIFYAGHQPVRYHNHAWFQDLALMTIGLAFPGWACADHWIDTALARITDQFEKLIVRDGRFAVFAENSIGYHLGIARLVANIGTFAELSGRETEIAAFSEGLAAFSQLMRYPDGKRTPGQGDTFRLANRQEGDPTGRRPYAAPEVAILPRAGYAVARANHEGRPFMLAFFATSRASTHKHADNLSFTLYLDGVEWLVDPSFHSHEYENPMPAYLRGPDAHNAFVMPGAHYDIVPGLASLLGEQNADGFRFSGEHRAVASLRFRRSITGSKHALDLEISDRLEWNEAVGTPGGARLMLHCGEGVEVDRHERGLDLSHPASPLILRLTLPEGSAARLWHGQEEHPVRGIAGQGFLQSAPITTIEITAAEADRIDWRLQAIEAEVRGKGHTGS